MNIRRWEYADILKIAQFEKDNFVDAWGYSQLADSFLSGQFYGYLAEDEKGEIMAIGAYNMALEEVDIVNVLVKKDMRGQGLGGQILDIMVEDMQERGVIRIFLEVRESNTPAQALYAKKGFYKVGERKGYYGGGETAIVMRKDVPRIG